ncbi:putative CHY-type Zn-finger protein [Flavobacterium arsenatis]|uniref:CHY-type Zn-finger protein n=1 Tax=Flavobacterium arsenatis TaxID=1484332 RepID=A0ABU1TQF2_9FLAO|nr:DUF4303 domain-containing protein [Flavobacterium arsenatis]MDR6968158.1 putative CHY-type Zn-finger protein [Flavobacterium arsenatis]
MKNFNKEEIKKTLLDFTVNAVEKFLKENPALEFYAFAYDCNAEYAEVNLCLNTEDEFEKTLKQYQIGEFSKYYQTEGDIKDLKFNTGDWEYQCFETINVLTNEQLDQIFNNLPKDDYKSWNEFVENLMKIFGECLLDFMQTETYQKIPKTKNFTAFCIDHDEGIEEAMERLENLY